MILTTSYDSNFDWISIQSYDIVLTLNSDAVVKETSKNANVTDKRSLFMVNVGWKERAQQEEEVMAVVCVCVMSTQKINENNDEKPICR